MGKTFWFLILSISSVIFLTGPQELTAQILQGKVTSRTGEPMGGASVTVLGTYYGVQTSSDGIYMLKGLKPGPNIVRVSFIGYETMIKELVIKGDTTLDIQLSPVDIVTDDVIISATRAGDQTPLAYSDISGEFLKKRNTAQDLPYLLSLTPSVIETSEAGNGIGYTSLRIRGTDASRINVTIDGIPLNDPESQQVFWVDIPDLASSVDNIQVQRGVGTSSNGAGAFGASINLQTRGIENEPFAEINSSAGSYGTFKNNITAGTGLLKDRFAFQLRYSDLRSNGFIERTGSEHSSAFMSALYRTDKSFLKANLILGKEHTGIGWWGVPAEMLDKNRRYNPAGEYTDESGIIHHYENESDNYLQNHFQLSYNRKISDNFSLQTAFFHIRGKGYYEEYKEDVTFENYGLRPVIVGGTSLDVTDLVRRKWMANNFYGLIYSVKARKGRIETIFGGGMNLYSGDHFGTIIWMKHPGTTEMNHQWYFNNGKKGEAGIYGKMTWSLSEKLSVFGDLQYRYINYNLKGVDDDLKDIGQSHNFNFFNPKAGLFVSFASNRKAYISFSIANREPTRTDFKEASGDNEAMPRSEMLFDTEMGYKMDFLKSSLAINVYSMIYKDQLVPTGELSNVGYPIMTNVDRSYRTGAEIIAGIIPADFIELTLNLTLSRNKILNFTEHYIDYNTSDWSSEYKSRKLGTVDIAYSPALSGNSDLAVKLHPSVRMHLISKYVGRQYFDNTMNSDRMLDPYFCNNVMIDFESENNHSRNASLQILVNNIFNTKYLSNAYGGNWFEDGTEKSWSYYFPQAGTNFLLKLGLKF